MKKNVLAIATFVASALLLTGSASAATAVPAAPAPCDTLGTPFLTLTQPITEPDSGASGGDWALDSFTEHVNVWLGTDGKTFCAIGTTTGATFVTTGPKSPEAGAPLAAGITGTFSGGETWVFPAGTATTTSATSLTLAADDSAVDSQFNNWQSQVFNQTTGASTYSFTYVTDASTTDTWTDAGAGDSGDITNPSISTVYVDASTGNDANIGSQAYPFKTIQAAVNAVSVGGTVHVDNGSYSGAINITTDGIQLVGQSEAGVVVTQNAGTPFGDGITVTAADGVSISDMTFITPAGEPTAYALHAYQDSDLTLSNLSFTGPGASGLSSFNKGIGGVDINSVDGVTMSNVSASDYSKNGFSFTAQNVSTDPVTDDVVLTNITANGNAWDGIAFYDTNSSGSAGGTIDSVTFAGTDNVTDNLGGGIFFEGDTDAHFATNATPAYEVTGPNGSVVDLSHVSFSGNSNDDIVNYQTDPVDAMGATFDPGAITGSQMTTAQRTTEDGKIDDGLDHPAFGLVTYYLAAPTNLTALFQYDSSDIASGTGLNITAKPGNNNLELLWSAPSGYVNGYHILITYPDGTHDLSYQGPNTNAWLATYDGFGAHGEGEYDYQVVAVNDDGTSDPSQTFTLYYDTQSPTAQFTTSPLPTYVSGDFSIAGTANDNAALTDAFFDVRDPSVTTGNSWISGCLSTSTVVTYDAKHQNATLSCVIDTTPLTDGNTYTLRIHAGDTVGYGGGQEQSIIVDKTAPALNSITPADNSTISGTVTFSASDTDANPSYVYVELNHNGGQWITDNTKSGTQGATSGTLTYDTTTLPNGTYGLKVDFVDKAGNTTEEDYTYTVDNTVAVTPTPLVAPTDLLPADGSTTNDPGFTQSWSAVPGAVAYEYETSLSSDGTDLGSVIYSDSSTSTSNYDISGDPVTRGNNSTPDGTYYWHVRAVDASGNAGPWSAISSVTVDTSVPTAPATPSAITDAATNVNSGDATLNGENGPVDAIGHSFWVSTSTIDTTSSTIPSGVYSSLDMGPIPANTAFSAQLSSIVANGVPSNLPAITPDTTYYVVAWTDVGGNWYPGAQQSFTTSAAPVVAPVADNGSFSTTDTTPVSITLSASGATSYTVVNGPSHGTLSGTAPNLTYTANADFAGTDTFTFTGSNSAGPSNIATVSITVGDTIAPVVTVISNNPAKIAFGKSYSDMGATATDNVDPTPDIVASIDGEASTSVPMVATSTLSVGTHTITYGATDEDGNEGYATRTVIVSGPPVITLTGDSTINLTVGDTYTEQGATATDLADGTDAVTESGTVDTTTPGTYTITYNATDSVGNAAVPVTRTVIVSAAPAPAATSAVASGGGGGGNGPVAGSLAVAIALPGNGSTAGTSGSGDTTGTTGTSGEVLGASVYNFTVNFGIGTHDNDVTQLQTILTTDGFYTGPINGSFGALTKAAVKKFQTANGITPVSGYVGTLTRAVLNKGSSPTMLQELQSELNALLAKIAALSSASSTAATTTAATSTAATSTASVQ